MERALLVTCQEYLARILKLLFSTGAIELLVSGEIFHTRTLHAFAFKLMKRYVQGLLLVVYILVIFTYFAAISPWPGY